MSYPIRKISFDNKQYEQSKDEILNRPIIRGR